MFCKQKGYLEEELDYRKQALDQAYMVRLHVHLMETRMETSGWCLTVL